MAGSPPNLHTMVYRLRPRCAQGQGQRSRDTGAFVLARKSLLEDYWDMWNYSLIASSLQSIISCIPIQFARWQHDCRQSLLSTIALLKVVLHNSSYNSQVEGRMLYFNQLLLMHALHKRVFDKLHVNLRETEVASL